MTSRTTRLWSGKKQDGRGAILGINRLMRQSPLCIEIRQEASEIVIWPCCIEGDRIFVERGDDSITRKHRRTFNNSRRADSIHPNFRSERNREFTNQVVYRRLAYVVGLAAAFWHDGICRTDENNSSRQVLVAKYFRCFFNQTMIGRHIYI